MNCLREPGIRQIRGSVAFLFSVIAFINLHNSTDAANEPGNFYSPKRQAMPTRFLPTRHPHANYNSDPSANKLR